MTSTNFSISINNNLKGLSYHMLWIMPTINDPIPTHRRHWVLHFRWACLPFQRSGARPMAKRLGARLCTAIPQSIKRHWSSFSNPSRLTSLLISNTHPNLLKNGQRKLPTTASDHEEPGWGVLVQIGTLLASYFLISSPYPSQLSAPPYPCTLLGCTKACLPGWHSGAMPPTRGIWGPLGL